MDKFLLFLKIVAWVLAILSTLIFIVATYLNITYPGSVDELRDKMNGKTRTYKAGGWLIVMIVCWAFIIAFW